MSDPYIGEIRMFGGSFAPAGWAMCAGQLQPISENEALFQLIGTTYGGDGQSTFALPDLQGRLPVHPGGAQNVQLAEKGGAESVTLSTQQIPIHSHAPLVLSGSGGGASTPTNQTYLADCQTTTTNTYRPFNAADPRTYPDRLTVRVGGPSKSYQKAHYVAAFLQDKWRFNRNLTVSLGARYDLEVIPIPETDNPLVSSYPVDKNNFQPRVGLTYDLGGGTSVLRGGYGRFYDKTHFELIGGLYTGTPFTSSS